MTSTDDRFVRLVLAMLPICIVVVGCGASLLPHWVTVELVEFLSTWLTVSVLVGILAGHCMLSESEYD